MDEFEAALQELFARKGKGAMRRALRDHPLQFLRLMTLAARSRGATPPSAPLTDEETDLRVIGLLRALGEERLTRLLARAREMPDQEHRPR